MAHRTATGVVALVAACAIAGSSYGVRAEDDKKKDDPLKQPPNAVEVSADELADKPAAYLGLRVKVRAEIDDVHAPRTFTLDEDKLGAGPDVLVLAPAGSFPKEGQRVEVTGTVRSFVRSEIKRDYPWFELDQKYDTEYSERPVIVAESVLPVK
jgi:hypothetical protein